MNMNRAVPKEDDEWLSGFIFYIIGFVACICFGLFVYNLSLAVFPSPVTSLDSDLYYLEKMSDVVHMNPNDNRPIYRWVPVEKSTIKLVNAATKSDSVGSTELVSFLISFISAIILCFYFKWKCFFDLLKRFPFLRTHHKWMMILLITSLCDIIEKSGSSILTYILCSFMAFLVTFIATTLKRDSTGLTEGALMGFTKLAIVFAFGQYRLRYWYSMAVGICAFIAKVREIKATASEIASAERSVAGQTAAGRITINTPSDHEERKSI